MKAILINKYALSHGNFDYRYTHALRVGFDQYSSVRCCFYVGSERAINQLKESFEMLPNIKTLKSSTIDGLDKILY